MKIRNHGDYRYEYPYEREGVHFNLEQMRSFLEAPYGPYRDKLIFTNIVLWSTTRKFGFENLLLGLHQKTAYASKRHNVEVTPELIEFFEWLGSDVEDNGEPNV